MAKTPTFAPSKGERGAALLEAAIALALVALVAGAGLTAFGSASRVSVAATAKLDALAAAENAIDTASTRSFLRSALAEGRREASGPDWRVIATPYEDELTEAESPLALIRLVATAGSVTLETIRAVPR